MGDPDQLLAWVLFGDGRQHRQQAGDDGFVAFVALGPHAFFDCSWPLGFDLDSSETLPWSGVALSQGLERPHGGHFEVFGDDRSSRKSSVEIAGDGVIEWPVAVQVCDVAGCNGGLVASKGGEWRVCLTLPASSSVPFGFTVADE
ncbi:MAG: hypothetical protein ACI91O_000340 [Candidatus Poriferisodalaceae bacterium]